MKRMILTILVLGLAIGFVYLPFPAAKLHIRIYFDEIMGEQCILYYATDSVNDFTGKQIILGEIRDGKQVDFCLDPSLAEHITKIRLDLPDREQMFCINNITLSSAGIIQKEYNPCIFFQADNVDFKHGILALDLLRAKDEVVILTEEEDPYIVFSEDFTDQIQSFYSHYRKTRVLICLFVFGCYFSWKMNKRSENSENEEEIYLYI